MPDEAVSRNRAKRMAEAIQDKLLANADIVDRADGKVTIAIFERGKGFDVKLNVTA